MRNLAEVQEAKELMNEAMEWSSFKWLWEKSKVRESADRANAALDHAERHIKSKWSDETKAAYKQLSGTKPKGENPQAAQEVSEAVAELVKKVLDLDHSAKRAKADAENAFEEAEKKMSTDLAREGCKKAIRSWELHEKAIRNAEALVEPAAKPPQ